MIHLRLYYLYIEFSMRLLFQNAADGVRKEKCMRPSS